MHRLITSTSPKEVGSNGVISPQVAISMQTWVTIAASSLRVMSSFAEAVAIDVVDMLVGGYWNGQFLQGR